MRARPRPKSATLLFALAAGVLSVGVGACGSSSTEPDPDPTPTSAVDVDDSFFSPMSALVEAGEVVTWTWVGGLAHDVTWDEADLPSSATQTTGTHEVTMPSEPGEYGYHCTVHGGPGQGMHGTVVIE